MNWDLSLLRIPQAQEKGDQKELRWDWYQPIQDYEHRFNNQEADLRKIGSVWLKE